MNKLEKIILLVIVVLMSIELMYVINEIHIGAAGKYIILNLLKFNTIALLFWILYSKYRLVEMNDEIKKNDKNKLVYKIYFYAIGFIYLMILGLFFMSLYYDPILKEIE